MVLGTASPVVMYLAPGRTAGARSQPLQAVLLDAVVAAFGKSALVSKASYTRVVVEGRTAGYVNVSTKKVTVDVPNGGSSYARVVVASKGDVSKAIGAAEAVDR